MRVITRNMRRANAASPAWNFLYTLKPDIALLQEVTEIPKELTIIYDTRWLKSTGKPGNELKFGTALLVKGKILKKFPLESKLYRVNEEIKGYPGNLTCYTIKPHNYPEMNVMPAYSPAPEIDTSKYPQDEVDALYGQHYKKLWLIDVIWSGLENTDLKSMPWIVAGDFNSSETMDKKRQNENNKKGWKSQSYNEEKEFLDSMKDLGFTECLRRSNDDKIIPTRKHSRGKARHQLDHMFVTKPLAEKLDKCFVGDESVIWKKGKSLSDHLPIVADFKEE